MNFSPTAVGVRPGSITIVDTATGSPHTLTLSGTGITAVKTAVISPSNLVFATQAVGTISATQNVTLFNTGNLPIAVSVPATAGDFQTATNCGATLLPARSCTTPVTFTPTGIAGTKTATLTMTTDAGAKAVGLSGTAVAASLTLGFAPTYMAFPAQQTATSSAARNLIIRNTGSAAVNITNITGTAEFPVNVGGCINTIQPGTNCTISVTFLPSAANARTGAITITSNATGSPQTVNLTETGSAAVPTTSLNPSGLAFSGVVGTTSTAQSVTLVNNSASSITGITLAHTGDFATPTVCAPTLAAGGTCFFSVTFTPTAAGLRTGTVTITDNLGTQTVSLAGFGVAASTSALLREATLVFPDQTVGITSPQPNAVLTNTGTTPLTVSSAVLGGTNPSDFSITSNGCTTVQAGQSCNIAMTFTPTATGARAPQR